MSVYFGSRKLCKRIRDESSPIDRLIHSGSDLGLWIKIDSILCGYTACNCLACAILEFVSFIATLSESGSGREAMDHINRIQSQPVWKPVGLIH